MGRGGNKEKVPKTKIEDGGQSFLGRGFVLVGNEVCAEIVFAGNETRKKEEGKNFCKAKKKKKGVVPVRRTNARARIAQHRRGERGRKSKVFECVSVSVSVSVWCFRSAFY